MTKAVELAQVASTGVSEAFKNRLINGNMVIDQRNAGASVSVSTSGVYVLDRWKNRASGGGVFSVQQSSTAPTGFNNSVIYTVTTADSSIAAGDNYWIIQDIEGFNVADLQWGTANAQTVTISFWVRSSVTGTFNVGLTNGTTYDRSYVSTYTINSANTFEYKTITVAGDTTGTWGKTNGGGISLVFNLGAGSSYQATANTWSAGFLQSTSGSTNWIATNGATFYLTGVQLEVGSSATSFEVRDYGREMMLCQRYYCELGRQIFGRAESGTITTMVGAFPVRMRASPTQIVITSTNAIGVPGLTDSNVSSVLTNNCNDNGMSLGILTSGSAMLTGAPTVGSQNRIFGFTAEL